ncbi:hypothetical protein JVT61DRAFT_1649 [Boletus reticuloceps]|uniref:Uncharacterized protein n=1 Tax=Boletus reticuloceps TaxID=495285 RepID=A0A8I2YTY3_9AGAM|nr:hypothetical protein JVT61DRAFT_1649 [Boletus reticuloceps]
MAQPLDHPDTSPTQATSIQYKDDNSLTVHDVNVDKNMDDMAGRDKETNVDESMDDPSVKNTTHDLAQDTHDMDTDDVPSINNTALDNIHILTTDTSEEDVCGFTSEEEFMKPPLLNIIETPQHRTTTDLCPIGIPLHLPKVVSFQHNQSITVCQCPLITVMVSSHSYSLHPFQNVGLPRMLHPVCPQRFNTVNPSFLLIVPGCWITLYTAPYVYAVKRHPHLSLFTLSLFVSFMHYTLTLMSLPL